MMAVWLSPPTMVSRSTVKLVPGMVMTMLLRLTLGSVAFTSGTPLPIRFARPLDPETA